MLGKGFFAEIRKQAVDKEALCREREGALSAKSLSTKRRQRRALGKVPVSVRKALYRVPAGQALGKAIFAKCLTWLSAKYFYFFVFCAEFFLWCFVSLLQTIF